MVLDRVRDSPGCSAGQGIVQLRLPLLQLGPELIRGGGRQHRQFDDASSERQCLVRLIGKNDLPVERDGRDGSEVDLDDLSCKGIDIGHCMRGLEAQPSTHRKFGTLVIEERLQWQDVSCSSLEEHAHSTTAQFLDSPPQRSNEVGPGLPDLRSHYHRMTSERRDGRDGRAVKAIDADSGDVLIDRQVGIPA